MDTLDIAPCQLQPNAYKIIHGLSTLFDMKDIKLDSATMFKRYDVKRSSNWSKGIKFFMKYKIVPLVHKISYSECLWNAKPMVIVGNVCDLSTREIPKKYEANYYVNLDVTEFTDKLTRVNMKKFDMLHKVSLKERWSKLVRTSLVETRPIKINELMLYFNVDAKYATDKHEKSMVEKNDKSKMLLEASTSSPI